MRLPRKHPRDGGKAIATWSFEKVPAGTELVGWKTGETFWCECHYQDQIKPCVAIMTNGAIQCPLDHGQHLVRWQGYVPMIGETGQPICVRVQGYSHEQVDAIPIGKEVVASRGKGRNKPVLLRRALTDRTFKGFESRRVNPAEFETWLLRLWALPSLLSFFSGRPPTSHGSEERSDTAVSLSSPPPRLTSYQHNPNDPVLLSAALNGVHRKPK